jgi:hypothetical protein
VQDPQPSAGGVGIDYENEPPSLASARQRDEDEKTRGERRTSSIEHRAASEAGVGLTADGKWPNDGVTQGTEGTKVVEGQGDGNEEGGGRET